MSNIYTFGLGDPHITGPGATELLGGKGAGLARMCANGVPVPPGFTITTEVCNAYRQASDKGAFMAALTAHEVLPAVSQLTDAIGHLPLLSVRSGARVSMPGMMDTVLNVGIHPGNMDFWSGYLDLRTAWDCYRRFLQMYGNVVLGIPAEQFEKEIARVKKYQYGLPEAPATDSEMTTKHWQQIVKRYGGIYSKHGHSMHFYSYEDQLMNCIAAVFESWDNPRAVAYRKMHGYPDDWGTAVNVQAMVFGNTGGNSCSGVLFTRDPDSGEEGVVGEFLVDAQGEDVVSGARTPEPMAFFADWDKEMATELLDTAHKLEAIEGDMQDVEFTVEDGKLWILQTRAGKRSARAAFKIAYDLATDGRILSSEAVARVTYKQYKALVTDRVDPEFKEEPLVVGIPAGGGVVTGEACLNADMAVAIAGNLGHDVVLVRPETTPDDIEGIAAARGILTATGGMTSHAAVVARGMDKACVVGATVKILGIKAGETVTIDGATGRVWVGVDVPVVEGALTYEAKQVVEWAIDLAAEQYDELVEVETDGVQVQMAKLPKRCTVSTAKAAQAPLVLHQILDSVSYGSGVEHVVLDLRTSRDMGLQEDEVLWDAFGQAEAPSWKVDLLTAYDLMAANAANKVTLVLPEGLTGEQEAHVRAAGWNVVTTVKDVDTLLKAKGVARLSPDFSANVGGPANAAQLLKVFEDAGRDIKPLREARTRAQIVAGALGQ